MFSFVPPPPQDYGLILFGVWCKDLRLNWMGVGTGRTEDSVGIEHSSQRNGWLGGIWPIVLPVHRHTSLAGPLRASLGEGLDLLEQNERALWTYS